jgi:hypothetical protein
MKSPERQYPKDTWILGLVVLFVVASHVGVLAWHVYNWLT